MTNLKRNQGKRRITKNIKNLKMKMQCKIKKCPQFPQHLQLKKMITSRLL